MRKLLLLFAFANVIALGSQAQTVCIPNPIYVSLGIPGVYPNPLIQANLTDGEQNVAYTEFFTTIVPADTTIDLSAYAGGFPLPAVTVSVNYQEVTALDGLPTGLNYVCDPSNCQWVGGTNGCIKLSGTPTQAGTFTVSMSTGYNVSVPQGIPVLGGTALTIPIPGLSWGLNIIGVGVDNQDPNALHITQNIPNPFHGTTTIRFTAPKPTKVDLTVTDLAGRVVSTQQFAATVGSNALTYDATALPAGIYLYRLSDGAKSVTSKMVVE
jgi:hypothetical protein